MGLSRTTPSVIPRCAIAHLRARAARARNDGDRTSTDSRLRLLRIGEPPHHLSKIGVKIRPTTVTPSMPRGTRLTHFRARTRGDHQWQHAEDKRRSSGSGAAAGGFVRRRRRLPSSSLSRANSTIRIAFLVANPTSTTKPIWIKMLTSCPIRRTPIVAGRHIGTTGSPQMAAFPAAILCGEHQVDE